jgi:subtilisin family serine protease
MKNKSHHPHRLRSSLLIIAMIGTAFLAYSLWQKTPTQTGAKSREVSKTTHKSNASSESASDASLSSGVAAAAALPAAVSTGSADSRLAAAEPDETFADAKNLPPVETPYTREPEIDLSKYYVSIQGKRAHPYRLIAKYKSSAARSASGDLLATRDLQAQAVFPLTPTTVLLQPTKPELVPVANAAEAEKRGDAMQRQIAELIASGKFAYVEPDYIVTGSGTPYDAAFLDGALWGLQNDGIFYQQAGSVAGVDIDAMRAWNLTTGSPTVTVAVIDSGVRYTHQDLAKQMWRNKGEKPGNGIDDDKDGYIDNIYGINAITRSGDPMDDNGHGTHVTGTIAAQANGGGPHVGVVWSGKVMACKSLDSTNRGLTSNAIACINFAVSKGATVLNASWGGAPYSQGLYDAIRAAEKAGALFIAAAGNSEIDNDVQPHYPSSYDHENIIAVAMMIPNRDLAIESNYGRNSVDIAAPGYYIYSTTYDSDTSYGYKWGTSMATPHVSGVAALVLARHPNRPLSETRHRILNGSVRDAFYDGWISTGARVNAYQALIAQPDGKLELNITPVGDTTLRPNFAYRLQVRVHDVVPVTNATLTGTFAGAPVVFTNDGKGGDLVANDALYTANIVTPPLGTSITFNLMVTASGKQAADVTLVYGLDPEGYDPSAGRTP